MLLCLTADTCDSRVLQALATREQKESLASLGHLAPQVLQGL